MIIDLPQDFVSVSVNDFGIDYVLNNSYLLELVDILPRVVCRTNIYEWFSSIFVLLNNLAQNNQFSIQALIAFGTIGTVVLALYPRPPKPRLEGLLSLKFIRNDQYIRAEPKLIEFFKILDDQLIASLNSRFDAKIYITK